MFDVKSVAAEVYISSPVRQLQLLNVDFELNATPLGAIYKRYVRVQAFFQTIMRRASVYAERLALNWARAVRNLVAVLPGSIESVSAARLERFAAVRRVYSDASQVSRI